MYDRPSSNDEDYAELRSEQSKEAIADDAFNLAHEIFVYGNKSCLNDAVEEAVDEILNRRNVVMDVECAISPWVLENDVKSQFRGSPLVQDGLPRRHSD